MSKFTIKLKRIIISVLVVFLFQIIFVFLSLKNTSNIFSYIQHYFDTGNSFCLPFIPYINLFFFLPHKFSNFQFTLGQLVDIIFIINIYSATDSIFYHWLLKRYIIEEIELADYYKLQIIPNRFVYENYHLYELFTPFDDEEIFEFKQKKYESNSIDVKTQDKEKETVKGYLSWFSRRRKVLRKLKFEFNSNNLLLFEKSAHLKISLISSSNKNFLILFFIKLLNSYDKLIIWNICLFNLSNRVIKNQ